MKPKNNFPKLYNRKSDLDKNTDNIKAGIIMRLLEKYSSNKSIYQIESSSNKQEQRSMS